MEKYFIETALYLKRTNNAFSVNLMATVCLNHNLCFCVSRSKMVQDSAQIRRQGGQDFKTYYDFACARQESVPLTAVTINLDKGILDFNGDRAKLTDWPPILNSICINKHLHRIAISSTYQAGSGDAGKVYGRGG